MKACRLLAGTIVVVFLMGFIITAYAIDEFGNLEPGDPAPIPDDVTEVRIVVPAAVNVVTNGDFETGDFTGWTTFLTSANGQINEGVVLFDTDGDTTSTLSAVFNVGEVAFTGQGEGGGIFQSVTTPAGTVMIFADIAAHDQGAGPNSSCGNYTLFFDGIIVDSHDFMECPSNDPADVERAQLAATIPGVSAGSHEVKIQIDRPFLSAGIATPLEYIDNVQVLVDFPVGGTMIPIDSTALLLAGAQMNAAWLIPVIVVAIGFAIVIARKL